MKTHLLITAATLVLAACAPPDVSYGGHAASPPVVKNDGSLAPVLDYATVKNEVLDRKCVGCHGSSGGVSLRSYASVMSHASTIRREVLDGNMPPSGSLSPSDRDLLVNWIDAGSPP